MKAILFFSFLTVYFLDDVSHVHDECHIINQSVLHYIYMYVECTWVLLTFKTCMKPLVITFLFRQRAVTLKYLTNKKEYE